MGAAHSAWVKDAAARAETAPKDLRDIEARIGRLGDRLTAVDHDMKPDEMQAAINAAEAKRKELLEVQPTAKADAGLIVMLPTAVDLYRRRR